MRTLPLDSRDGIRVRFAACCCRGDVVGSKFELDPEPEEPRLLALLLPLVRCCSVLGVKLMGKCSDAALRCDEAVATVVCCFASTTYLCFSVIFQKVKTHVDYKHGTPSSRP